VGKTQVKKGSAWSGNVHPVLKTAAILKDEANRGIGAEDNKRWQTVAKKKKGQKILQRETYSKLLGPFGSRKKGGEKRHSMRGKK